MARIVFALATSCVATATATAIAQTPDARTIVQAAVESMRAAQTVTYDAELQVRSGDSWRIVAGHVQLAGVEADDASDPIGGRLAVRGEIRRSSSSEIDAIEAAYDGVWMRRTRAGARTLLRGHPGFGGEELLRGSFGELILRDYLAPEPLAAVRGAVALSSSGQIEVHGVRCDVVEARLDDAGRRVEWAFGVEDHLPRKMRRWFRSARGTDVESVLTFSNIKVNTDIDPAVFTLDTPEGYVVETVGKRPPRETKVGDPSPEWEVTGSDGKTHKLSDYRGKLVLMEFWASWCTYCRRSMPAVQKMHDTYSERGVVTFGLNCRDRGDVDPVAFMRGLGYSYFVADGNEAAIDYRVGSLPAFYVIDGEGRLLHTQTGYSEEKERQLIGIIERYLDEQGR
ncbi:MAG: TlpA family protein disulfide reductase [Planctomycetota bacterium]|jgi:thiol-disulfide isomerase/thioredoxin